MEKFIKYFEDTSLICKQFADTVSGIQFDEESQAIELFSLTSINMCSQHCKTISILLKNNIITDCFIIARNLIEISFNLNWVSECNSREEINDRIFKLEANPYLNFEKEIKLMEREIDSDKPNLSKSLISQHRIMIDQEKQNYPFLLADRTNLNSEFKSAPPFSDRMGDVRLLYYHLYRFSSMFTHPSPKLKEFFMHRLATPHMPIESIVEPLKITLSQCLLFIKMTYKIAMHYLFEFNTESNLKRNELIEKLDEIVKISNENYYGTKPRK